MEENKMDNFSKLLITGELEVLTGLHIGGSDAYSAIGAIDSPVIRDGLSQKPLIPGSSLKGKMRSLLAKAINTDASDLSPNGDDIKIRRLFGDSDDLRVGRLVFRDSVLANEAELKAQGAGSLTEGKWENTINRKTLVANPRQIERVIPGSKFKLELIYDVLALDEIITDMQTIASGFKLLELDYLGGNGSRGYGKIQFNDIKAELAYGDLSADTLAEINEVLNAR